MLGLIRLRSGLTCICINSGIESRLKGDIIHVCNLVLHTVDMDNYCTSANKSFDQHVDRNLIGVERSHWTAR